MNEERFKREVDAVKNLGDQIGYGNMMTIASALWAKMLIDEGETDSGVFYPTVLSNMKPGDLTECSISERAGLINLLKKWESEAGTERQTGKWFKKYNPNYSPFDYSSEYIYTCSECGFDTTGEYNYCPECGAKNKIDQEDIQDE